jgi:bifunctional DNA-binding transcriptional regulator/antitoxin component of YhaV-PrlF toxin-antitoxin module
MTNTGEVRVSQRGQMSLPADARHRWGLDDGGDVSYVDVGDAVILIPEGADALRRRLIDAVTDEEWQRARRGLGDADLVSE